MTKPRLRLGLLALCLWLLAWQGPARADVWLPDQRGELSAYDGAPDRHDDASLDNVRPLRRTG